MGTGPERLCLSTGAGARWTCDIWFGGGMSHFSYRPEALHSGDRSGQEGDRATQEN